MPLLSLFPPPPVRIRSPRPLLLVLRRPPSSSPHRSLPSPTHLLLVLPKSLPKSTNTTAVSPPPLPSSSSPNPRPLTPLKKPEREIEVDLQSPDPAVDVIVDLARRGADPQSSSSSISHTVVVIVADPARRRRSRMPLKKPERDRSGSTVAGSRSRRHCRSRTSWCGSAVVVIVDLAHRGGHRRRSRMPLKPWMRRRADLGLEFWGLNLGEGIQKWKEVEGRW